MPEIIKIALFNVGEIEKWTFPHIRSILSFVLTLGEERREGGGEPT